MREYTAFEQKNVAFLVNKQIAYATIHITATGLKKSILDATAPVRTYFLGKDIHDYEAQPQGPEHKCSVCTYVLTDMEQYATQTSLYRPITKKGDPRMWVYRINAFVRADDILALVADAKTLYVINLSQVDIERACSTSLENPIKALVDKLHRQETSTASELLDRIRASMSDWIPSEVQADTGIGRTIESRLGITMNASKAPDYKGIELKSKRERAKVRSALFTQAPNWSLSRLKSGKAITEVYGYIPDGYTHKCLHVTLSAIKPNAQALALYVNKAEVVLEANAYADGMQQKIANIAVWKLIDLHERLCTKHRETFWLDVETRMIDGREHFRVTTIEHTKRPVAEQFDVLLEQGKITVDMLLCRKTGGDTYSFKIGKNDRKLLFPECESYTISS